MENDRHMDEQFTSSSTTDNPESAHHGGVFFHGAQDFTVSGGTFNNVTNHYTAPRMPLDFRMIPLGDIDLQHEIRLDRDRSSSVVGMPSDLLLPDCLAYWSLDPSGVARLSPEEASELGFPSIRPYTTIYGSRWDANVYAGLRQFHQIKGFDPDSQDVAEHLGYPLYQLSRAMDPLFAHVDEEDSYSIEDDQNPVTTDTDHGNHTHNPTTGTEEPALHSLHEEMPISRTFGFLMNVQWILILFLTLSWLSTRENSEDNARIREGEDAQMITSPARILLVVLERWDDHT
ncbi:hypothetical protein B0H13DRAFT_2680789 [Mycena leptocephala]|nr:hypothetical protein B0H13DRAFT_2680789 [Mycena leptocephala]